MCFNLSSLFLKKYPIIIKIIIDKTTRVCYSTYRTTAKGVEYEYKEIYAKIN